MDKLSKWLIGVGVLLFFTITALSARYLDWLWFKSLGATTVFWVPLLTGPLTKLILGLLVALFFIANLFIAARAFNRLKVVDHLWPDLNSKTILLPGLVASLALAAVLTAGVNLDWTVVQQFLNQVKVGQTDPIFHQDLSFYLFSYPFYNKLINLLQIATFFGLIISGVIYFLAKAFWRQGRSWELWHPAKLHLTVLTVIFLGLKIFGYNLGKYSLLLNDYNLMTGVNYTAAHARILAFNLSIGLVILIIGILLFSLFRKGSKLLFGSLILWLGISFILGVIYPGVVQSFIVTPNEKQLEQPYLKNHIQFTRTAYGLNQIKEEKYPYQSGSAGTLDLNHPSLTDLRLWDYEPLNASYNQLQAIRPYYKFNDIDIDRYPDTNGNRRQMMLSARELNIDGLSDSARASWLNLHLGYTHGYGYAANQVNLFTPQGQPVFTTKDLPPKTEANFESLKVKHPGIYFGESTDHYIIVNSKTPEFDFPQGETNTSTTYQGPAGISLNSSFTKLLLALRFQETNFIFSSQLTKKSSILLYRNIRERVTKYAPFLTYDRDPYLVVSQGKLYWIIDAYTTSTYYPYSRHYKSGINYIRNSVKAVIDAYTGKVQLYVVDSKDPLIQVWQKIFPKLFLPVAQLDPVLKEHFRYPEGLMTIQRDLLLQYHMTNPGTFYEKEDYWDIPMHNQNEPFEPYYVTLSLTGEKQNEFILMQPFSPRGKPNLISWLVARCDQPNYGQLILYTLPKDQNIYGPAQIDSRINQDQTISQLVTLWNQQESQVRWGNLLIIPINNELLYVKPLFMESQRGRQAELKKIVMVYQNQVLLGDTVNEALSKLSGVEIPAIDQKPASQEASPINRKTELLKLIEANLKSQQRLIDEQSKLTKELQNLSE